MIKLKDIIIDRINGTIPFILILSLPYFFEILNLKISPLLILIIFVFNSFFQLITSENYLIDYQIVNNKINFTYKVTLSKKLQEKEIDLNSVKKIEFQSKSNRLEKFNGITVKYENIDKSEEWFSLKIKSDSIWLQIINEFKQKNN
ncbi:hypothetical protein ACG2LH_16465 [Zhouia sp. PK063]|uniref:hypothetical protein n=1 Tax=Zhouia sp. PK063 TaxID=3373602 RepID=UPI0037AE28BE